VIETSLRNNLFSANPQIERVARPVSIVSGGIAVDVYGKGLDLLQRPHMVVTYEDTTYYGPKCELLDEHLMVCRTPGLEDLPAHRRASLSVDRPVLADYGFDLDGTLTGNLTIERPLPRLTVYDDPRLVPFGEVLTIRSGGDLVIKGASLNVESLVMLLRWLQVLLLVNLPKTWVEKIWRSLFLLATGLREWDMFHKMCETPTLIGWLLRLLLPLLVSSSQLRSLFCIGWLCLEAPNISLFIYRRKNTSHNRQLRFLKNQMSSIEMKVAQECKAAFVELQTNMNAIAHSMPQGSSFIPLLTYKDYTARILFPHSFNNHPVLSDLAVESERAESVESGLRQLNRLLLNSDFLLSFVRTIDENKYLLLKDRVYVGSLLMVILQVALSCYRMTNFL
jgi:hypothetical protein